MSHEKLLCITQDIRNNFKCSDCFSQSHSLRDCTLRNIDLIILQIFCVKKKKFSLQILFQKCHLIQNLPSNCIYVRFHCKLSYCNHLLHYTEQCVLHIFMYEFPRKIMSSLTKEERLVRAISFRRFGLLLKGLRVIDSALIYRGVLPRQRSCSPPYLDLLLTNL